MIHQLREAFPEIEVNCLKTITNKHTFVFENQILKKGVFVNANENFHLHIENKTNSYFYFVQNDDCVMKSVKGGQCDYVIGNNQSLFFTEIKVATGNLANHRKEAYLQLENTFKYYSKKINFENNFHLNALICFPKKKRIAPQPSKSTKKKEFKIKYQINLEEGNYILFE